MPFIAMRPQEVTSDHNDISGQQRSCRRIHTYLLTAIFSERVFGGAIENTLLLVGDPDPVLIPEEFPVLPFTRERLKAGSDLTRWKGGSQTVLMTSKFLDNRALLIFQFSTKSDIACGMHDM